MTREEWERTVPVPFDPEKGGVTAEDLEKTLNEFVAGGRRVGDDRVDEATRTRMTKAVADFFMAEVERRAGATRIQMLDQLAKRGGEV